MTNSGQPPLLEVLEPEARRQLMTHARLIRVRKGQALFSRGEASTDVLIIHDGRVRVLLYGADGREVSLRELAPGQLIGELAALDGVVRSASAVAVTDARLMAFSQRVFRELIETSPAAADWLLRRLVAQVRNLTDRVFELSALNVQTRLHCELLRLARKHGGEIDPSPTHAELASRIATHREAVTRELSALEERNVLRSGRRRLTFLNLEQLEKEVQAKLRTPIGDEAGW
ncbi:Crp/Fnr family transcriptional regulator [Phenylobacterium sp.]|uniref:Crp/Fnr family transcriptional regulator n=1 Tax=Phenylobacterium sp. TaxID=1871053 RepID=UPI0035AEAAAD